MATTNKIVFSMMTTSGKKSYTVNYADPEATAASVRALANGYVTNAALFDPQPVSCTGAKLVVTTETAYELSA